MLLEAGLIEEHSACLNSGCAAALGKSTSGSDARVSCLKLDDHMLSVEDLLETAKDLLVKALLNLRTPCKVLNDAIELGEANNLAVGEVTNMSNTTEEEEVVLAHRGERNIFLEDH